MRQLIIHNPDGTSFDLYDKTVPCTCEAATQNIGLGGINVVNLTVKSAKPLQFRIGGWCEIYSGIYKINRLPSVQKKEKGLFYYYIEAEGIQYDLLRATYDLTIDTTNNQLQDIQADALTGNLYRFATVLVANANRVFPGKWALGTCPSTETKTLMFGESDNCLAVLQTLCSEYGYEFEITQNNGVNTLHFKAEIGQLFPHIFQWGKGKGLYFLERKNVDSSNIITRLKVYGSTDNITSKYRANRLCLPGKTKGQSYIEKAAAVAKYGIFEATKYFDAIKPTFNGCVTATNGNLMQFADSTMFDLNEKESDNVTTKYLIPGLAAKIHFNTGNLAGYEFEISRYDHSTHTFTLIRQTDDRGNQFPSSTSAAFQIAVGDEYKILDIAMPATIEAAAETELSGEGDTYYDQNSQPKVQYSLSITDVYLKALVGSGSSTDIFMPGDLIQIKDADIDVDKAVRIKSLTRNLINEYEYSLVISDTVSTSITDRVISDLIDLDKIISINNLNDPAKARANWRSSRELLAMVFDPEGDYYTEKIKPNSIDTLALSVGAKSMQFGLVDTVFEPNFNGNKNSIKVTGGTLTHYTINETSARTWILANNTTTLDADDQAYYIYAKCERTGTAGVIVFSTDTIPVEEDTDYYHFWIGVLHSVDPDLNVRGISLMYGFTMINGRYISTGRIQSHDGETYFDLDNSEIGGKITFKAGTSGYANITDAPDVESLMSDFEEYLDSAFVDGIISEAEAAAIGTYINNINSTKAAVEAQYTKLYANSFLTGTAKTGLYNAKAALMVAINDIITSVENAIADGKTTETEKADVDAKFVLYSTALATYNTAVETANKAIQDAINATATNAANTASTANNKATSALSTAEAASNAANAAASTANAASTAAGNAATAAAGKAKVFYATSAPTSGMQTNDLWVNGTDIYRYSGSAWVLASAYDVTLTQINGGLITTGAISFGQTGGMAASGTLRIWAGGTGGANGAPPTTPTFRVYADGSVYARNSVIVENSNGVVQAGISSYGTATESVRIWSGAASPDSGTFRVMANGNVYANWATVTNLYGNIIDLRDPNNVNNYTWLWGNKGAPGLTIKRTEEANTNPVNGINIDYGMSSTVARSISFHFRRFSNEASWFFRTCIKASKLPSVTQINALSGTGSTRWNLKWDEASGYIYIE